MNETREKLEVDLLLVGGGIASLATAYQFMARIREINPSAPPLEIAIIEKCREVGDSILSGAVMDPSGIELLMPDWLSRGAPVEAKVEKDAAYFLTSKRAFRFPITPPPLRQHGNYILSLSKFTRWLAGIVQGMGVNVFAGFSGKEILYEGRRVVGVRTGDKGINKKGEKKENYEPGIDIHAKVTVLGEGVRGSLTRQLIERLRLDAGRNPPSYGTGVKEVWELKPGRFPKGLVYHTMGFPLLKGGIGGGWLYGMENNLLSLGYVTWLSYKNPLSDPHQAFQLFKTHPFIRQILEGGKMVQYGAKAVSVGGYYSIPKMYGDGFLLVGESANLVDGQRLKGVHMALGSGKMAGDTLAGAFKRGDFSENSLKAYQDTFEKSGLAGELKLSRNFHQSFEHGFVLGLIRTGIQTLLKGRDILGDRLASLEDVRHMKKISQYYPTGIPSNNLSPLSFDNKFLFDKLTDVYLSGALHEEDQPSHLIVPDTKLCIEKCTAEYGNPCTRFCPAEVYEIEENAAGRHLKINASNCVHCKTCDIMDPYANILWTTPEGGGGPRYTLL